MTAWMKVASAADFPIGERRVLEVEGVRVVVFHLEDGFFAIEDVCTHDGGELASGKLDCADAGRCEIVCPRHGARFDVRTGAVTTPPAYEPVPALSTRMADGWVEVRDARLD